MFRIVVFLLAALMGVDVLSQDKVLTLDVREDINSTAWTHVRSALGKADAEGATSVVVHLNTYGGELVFADSIRTAILASRRPVYAFVDVNAASAGALIALACDSIFMSPGASIGAATVVDGSNGEKLMDKYQSYMRAMMRSTAEAQGFSEAADGTRVYRRDPRIAEAFVDESISIDGVVDSLHILTLTSNEALKLGYCDGIMNSLEEVVGHVAPHSTVVSYEPTAYDNIRGGLLSTWLRGILILVIIGGIYFELQTPGVGFPLLASVVAAVLYFAPLYIDGLAANWEVAMFVIGVLLVAAEVFLIPGFGVAGVLGGILVICGFLFSLVNNDGLEFDAVEPLDLTAACWTVTLSLIGSVVLCVFLGRALYKTKKGGPLSVVILDSSQEASEGFVGVEKEVVDSLIGSAGVAETDLRPGGKVRIGGEAYDAISDGGYIERGTRIEVRSTSSGQVVVRKLEE